MADRTPLARPRVELLVDGRADRGLAESLLAVEVTERVGGHGTATLTLAHGAPGKPLPEEYPVQPGAALEVRLGASRDAVEVFSGPVTGVSLDGRDGGLVMRVVASSYSVLLDAGPRTRVLADTSDADLLRMLAEEHGLDAEVGSALTEEAIGDTALTDWQRVLARCARNGWVAYTRGRTLVARPPDAVKAVAELRWGAQLLEVELTEDLTTRHDPTVAVAWDPLHRETLTASTRAAEAGAVAGDRPDLTKALAEAGLTDREGRYAAALPADQAHLDALSHSGALAEALRHVSGTVLVAGDPSLRADRPVSLAGLGRRLDGLHYVSGVHHVVSGGRYTTTLRLGLPQATAGDPAPGLASGGLGLGASVDVAVGSQAASGGVAGLTIGIVEALEDPTGHVRVQVRLAALGDLPGVWARLAVPDAGDGSGTFFLPSVGDEVVVGFLGGELAAPVVLGAMWSPASTPPEQPAQDNPVRSVVTPAGHTLRFDDGDGGMVELRSADGRRVLLDDGGHRVELADPAGTSVVLDANGVAVTAEQGDVVLRAPSGEVRIEGLDVRVAASASATVEGEATLDLKSSGTLTVLGSLVRIN